MCLGTSNCSRGGYIDAQFTSDGIYTMFNDPAHIVQPSYPADIPNYDDSMGIMMGYKWF